MNNTQDNKNPEKTHDLHYYAGHIQYDMTNLIKWLLLAVLTGLTVGFISSLFARALKFVTTYRIEHFWVFFLLPAAGLVIVFLYQKLGQDDGGTNQVLSTIRSQDDVPFRSAPLIFVSTILTHFAGGSAGREGAAIQLGGSIGNQLGSWFHLDEEDRHVMVMCGMSAAFSALFGTPLAAAVFPMEVASVGIMHYAALVPCVCASIVASRLALYFGMQPEAFPVLEVPEFTGTTAGAAVLLGILCAIISIVFCVMLHQVGAQFKKFSNPYVKAAVGGALILAITLLLGTQDCSSAGIPLIERALEGEVRPEAFLLKMILTAITLGCGFKGGEIVPSFCVGATFGALFGQMLGLSPALYGAAGMAAGFCGGTNCPISTLLISFEMFGFEGMLYYAIAVSISYMLSGYYSLYHDQKIMYSKVKTEFINRKSK